MSFENYETNGHMHDLMIISHESHVQYLTRSGFFFLKMRITNNYLEIIYAHYKHTSLRQLTHITGNLSHVIGFVLRL